MLAKCRTRSNKNRWNHSPNRGGFVIVTADEVLEKLLGMGIKRDKRTLRRYAKEGLITPPNTQSLGRNKGRISDYDDAVPYEVFANFQLMHGIGAKPEQIKIIRNYANKARAEMRDVMNEYFKHNSNIEERREYANLTLSKIIDEHYDNSPELKEQFPNRAKLKVLAYFWILAWGSPKYFNAEVAEELGFARYKELLD